MASPTQNFTRRLYHVDAAALTVSTTLAAYALAIATMYAVALVIGGGRLETALAELVGLGLVPLAVARVHQIDLAALGVVRPRVGHVIAAAVAGAGLWLIALRVAAPIIALTHREREVEAWASGLFADQSLAATLVALVGIPAVCEELTHRGLLAAGLARPLGRPLAIAASTAAFALLHIEPARMAATAVLGAAAGLIAARTRSLWPAIALHATNNLIVALLSLGYLGPIARQVERHPDGALAAAAALAAIGLLGAGGIPARARSGRSSGRVQP
ncbi:MAG: CPBP family intramembrane glutamic endopeptidase [Kofleriaceae bacterium]